MTDVRITRARNLIALAEKREEAGDLRNACEFALQAKCKLSAYLKDNYNHEEAFGRPRPIIQYAHALMEAAIAFSERLRPVLAAELQTPGGFADFDLGAA